VEAWHDFYVAVGSADPHLVKEERDISEILSLNCIPGLPLPQTTTHNYEA
jgi:hypothetical protein